MGRSGIIYVAVIVIFCNGSECFIYKPVTISDSLVVHFSFVPHSSISDACQIAPYF
jgi:hypothetical protein